MFDLRVGYLSDRVLRIVSFTSRAERGRVRLLSVEQYSELQRPAHKAKLGITCLHRYSHLSELFLLLLFITGCSTHPMQCSRSLTSYTITLVYFSEAGSIVKSNTSKVKFMFLFIKKLLGWKKRAFQCWPLLLKVKVHFIDLFNYMWVTKPEYSWT